MNKLDRYVGMTVFWSFLIVAFILLGLDFALTFIDQLKRVNDNYRFNDLLQVLLLRSPGKFAEYIPISALIGALVGLGSMASNSELTVMRAAGLSIWRIGLSALQPVIIIAFFGLWISEYVAPDAEQKADLIEKLQNQKANKFSLTGGVWIRVDDNFVYINAADNDGVLYGIKIYTPDEHKLSSIMTAKNARHINDEEWQLENITITHFLANSVTTEKRTTLPWKVSLQPEHLFLATQEAKSLSLRQSLVYQEYLNEQKLDASRYSFEFWNKALRPLASIALVIIALSTVFGSLRSSTMGGRIFVGVLIGIGFHNGLHLFGKMSLILNISPFYGVSVPILITLFIGMSLINRFR